MSAIWPWLPGRAGELAAGDFNLPHQLRDWLGSAFDVGAAICRSHHGGQPSRCGIALIDLGVDAVSPEPIGMAQHALLVLDRVAAVADEAARPLWDDRFSSAVLPIDVARPGAPATRRASFAADHHHLP